MGVTVVSESADDQLSGFLLRNRKRGHAVIGVNDDHHPNRRRFTIAHELGHFLLHEGEELHIDKVGSGYEIKRRDGKSSAGIDIDEMEANLFAAELLMPVDFLNADLAKLEPVSLSDDEKINLLASRYGVSTQALTLRLTYLGYVSQ
jgi:Zn-dependent peptidase ImmA (M78 family)